MKHIKSTLFDKINSFIEFFFTFTRETYYYRMRVLREACLDYTSIQSMSDTEEQASTVGSRFVELQPCYGKSTEATPVSVTIRIGNAAIEVADTISDEFFQRIVEVVSHA